MPNVYSSNTGGERRERMIKEIIVCDGCKMHLEKPAQRYQISSDWFVDAAGSRDCNLVTLDLCEECCEDIVASLKRIAEQGGADIGN